MGEKVELLSLKDINCHADIPETADTLEGNAMLKAEYIFENYGLDCFADDTGLEVEALNGAPGVYSARYAGSEGHNAEANMQKLLQNMQGVQNRKAQFRTAIGLILDGGTTEIGVTYLGGLVLCKSVKVGGDKIDRSIIEYVRQNYNLFIGERTAENPGTGNKQTRQER